MIDVVNKNNLSSSTVPKSENTAIASFSADFGTPISLFHRLSENEKNAFLFESTEGDGRLARYSFLGVDPLLTVSFKDTQAIIADPRTGETKSVPVGDPIDMLRRLLEEYPIAQSPDLAEVPFAGGLVGYMGYGAAHYLEKIELQKRDPFAVPIGHYGLYDSVIIFDHQYRRVTFFSARGQEHMRRLLGRALYPAVLPPLRLDMRSLSENEIFDGVAGPFTKEEFVNAVKAAKEYIYEGQVFQIVVSQRFALACAGPAIDVYRALQATNPSPYAYFLKCPDYAYIGSSPETFVRCTDGQVFLRAIAGTRHRGRDAKEDAVLAKELRESEKEMAEHRMLVDLGRNDLGRVCTPGTVRTGDLACLTKYTHVMHLATEITGQLDEGRDCFDAFKSCFPAGTVSGAPKVRAMELLAGLEPEQRGIYSGAVGYFDGKGSMDGAIAIRSLVLKDGVAHVNAGAGIVFDSDPEMEYEETRNKAKSILQAIKIAGRLAEGI